MARAGRRPGQRAGLDAGAVTSAAHDLIAEHGVEALTMRALAERLGVSPNTLYSHVEDKAALVDAVLDDVLGAVEVPSTESRRPMTGVRALMASTYDVLIERADLVPLYLGRQGARGANAHRLGDVTLTLLDAAGVSPARARAALHVLVVYTIGSAAFATQSPLALGPSAPRNHRGDFERGLDWILAGVAAGR